MSKTPSDPHYSCSSNPSDSSEDINQLVDSWIVSPVREEDYGTSDSERTESFGHIPSDGYGHVMEADSGYDKAGDRARSDAQKHEKKTPLKTDQDKSALYNGHREVIRLQGKSGLLKILPQINKKVVKGTSDGNVVSTNTKMDGDTDVNIILANTETLGKTGDDMIPTERGSEDKKMAPLPLVIKKRERLPLPQWLKDYKSEVADLNGWLHEQVHREDDSGRKDKYYKHRDYVHTFRSKVEVQDFLKTGEVKGKGLLKKKSADPSGQSSGPRRSTKKRKAVPASDPIEKPQGFSWSTRGEMAPNSSKLPRGFV